jgi:hypothetical protein
MRREFTTITKAIRKYKSFPVVGQLKSMGKSVKGSRGKGRDI